MFPINIELKAGDVINFKMSKRKQEREREQTQNLCKLLLPPMFWSMFTLCIKPQMYVVFHPVARTAEEFVVFSQISPKG